MKMHFRIPAWCALALGLLAHTASAWQTLPSWNADDPNFQYTPSPADWRSTSIYHLMTDRFSDGNTANNGARGDYDPTYGSRVHGGDFKGIEQKLPYLKELGVKAIWISPVNRNVAEDANGDFPYHGYLPTDFNSIESQFGSLAELRSLVFNAHQQGLYVILDIVVNHMADLQSSRFGNNAVYNPAGYFDMWWHRGMTHAEPFNTLSRFHNKGAINNYEDSQQYLLGDLTGGLDDLMTEDWGVRNDLATSFKALISATDCDGFRIDAVKHVEMDFWPFFLTQIRNHAATLGKTNFFMFGEVFSRDDALVSSFTGPDKFKSMLNFPWWETVNDVFVYGKATSNLTHQVNKLSQYDTAARGQMVNFLDNHDRPRILSAANFNGDTRRAKAALTWLFTSPGVPCLYYGTEQAFNGGNDPFNREDMWDGAFEQGPSLGDNFNTQHDLFRFVKSLGEIRAAYPQLVQGTYTQRWQTSNGPGLHAFSRHSGQREAIVAFNTHSAPQSGFPAAQSVTGTKYVNLLDPSQISTVTVSQTLPVTLGAYASQIYVPAPEVPVSFVGNTHHWPTNGALTASNTVWINTESWPRGAGRSALVVFSTNRVTWEAAPLTRAGEQGNNDWWNANIGKFPAGSTVEYAVAVIDHAGAYRWDSRGGQNFKAIVKAAAPAPSIQWIGKTYNWPASGQATAADNIWINTQTWPKNAGVSASVVYTTNGTTWHLVSMAKAGVVGNDDWWNLNLGKFPAGTTVRYAVSVKDANGKELWDNNGGQDFRATVK